ncbi:hypothetical protein IT882_15800 [Microbacterium schleiferi]|uniref:Uncharacterized protein n=1 Tax=Microbacterium schleiferi TaxID=69362 RepID=A0A7S8MWF2_9MICO|nr:hypothetical protein [Microbacterium schleiferi]QPE04559.1 hypothetical protein IT882_15800 [Microbacterium schleiferi]
MLNSVLIQAPSRRGYAWVNVKSSPRLSPVDRSEMLRALQWGRLDELPAEPRFARQNKGRKFGDLLWTTGPTKIASARFVSVLDESRATGYSTFPVEVENPPGIVLPRYHGLVVFGRPGDDCFSIMPAEQHWKFGITGALLRDLRAAGADDFEILEDSSASAASLPR